MIKRMVKKNLSLDAKDPPSSEDPESAEAEVGDEEDEPLGSPEEPSPSPSAESAKAEPTEQKSPKQSCSSPVKTQGPDNQTLLRLLDQGEQLHSMFRCARIQGLDTLEGLLLFGREHYYVVDGFTLLKTREIRDLDFLPEQFHDPIIPYMAMGSTNR